MAKQIQLMIDGEKKKFFQPQHVDGDAALDALDLGKEMEKKGDDIERSDFERVAEFISEKLYNNKFTRDELIKGTHATLLFETLMDQLRSVMVSNDESGKSSKEKKD